MKVYTEDVLASIEDEKSQIEDATANKVHVQHAQRLKYPTQNLQ